ncbi:unnamed protein product [Nesidiocoris tenuis]|uniref:Uncharacterized protein n=1 Tax=Nesidiocoris tenuis TaxID=355587 RepID=A0A6H5HV80_9HEMI|nr:unnamed protein product [Nesidiocoris tenuis]
MEAIRTCDLPSASSNDQQKHNNSGTSVNDEGTRRRFYDNPVFTNVQYLVRQDRQFDVGHQSITGCHTHDGLWSTPTFNVPAPT